MEKVYKKHLADSPLAHSSDEFRQSIPVARAITIYHATELHEMIQQKEMLSCTVIMSDYAAMLIGNGRQRDSLLQVVEQHQQLSYLPIMSTMKSLL